MHYRFICPHCGTKFSRILDPAMIVGNYPVIKVTISSAEILTKAGAFKVHAYTCMTCAEVSVDIVQRNPKSEFKKKLPRSEHDFVAEEKLIPIIPFGKERPVPDKVPKHIADDYKEATKISNISLKGASTLARRALQATLRDVFTDMPRGELYDEIKWVEENKKDVHEDIIKALHVLRKAGNFGAHPPKDGLTAIYELSENDLETCFMILDILFEECYVKPAEREDKINALHKKVFPAKKPKKSK